MVEYPKVLILSRTPISEFNSQGAALGGWFRDWPKERLAHLFSTDRHGIPPYCGHLYQLSGRERRLGRLFDHLKRAAMGNRQPPQPPGANAEGAGRSKRMAQMLRRWGWDAMVDTGLWEVLLPPVLSPQLRAWVAEFRPDAIFASVTDLGYMRFAQLLQGAFHVPICLEIADDWPATLYRGTLISPFVRAVLDRTLRRLLAQSTACLTIGKEMERDYRCRYERSFEALMCCEEPDRFTVAPRRLSPTDEITIAYCGSLYLNRWKSLVELLKVVDALQQQGTKVCVNLYSSEFPSEAVDALTRQRHLRFQGTPHHTEVPAILKGADILFHAESFEPRYRDYIRLSISSKSQVYMISGVPILVYGPPEAGVVKYAREDGWAYVVDRPDQALLQEAVTRLAGDQELRCGLADAAKRVFYQNHNAATVRERLRQILCEAVETAGPREPQSCK